VGFKRHIFSTLISLHSLLLCGAIFGYFYAWICPTPWGLDQIDPNTAITAMQAMNASVRNVVYVLVFFATPVVLLASALLAFGCGNRRAAWFYHGRSDLRVWWNGADHGHKRPLEPSPCVDRNAVGPGAGQRGPECLLRDLAILEYHSTLRGGCGAVVDRVGFAKADPNRARQCKRLRL
jgi:hypothetical protein